MLIVGKANIEATEAMQSHGWLRKSDPMTCFLCGVRWDMEGARWKQGTTGRWWPMPLPKCIEPGNGEPPTKENADE